MLDTVQRYINSLANMSDRAPLRAIFRPVADRMSTQVLSTPGLAIKTGGSTLVKTGGSACYAMVNGTLVKIAASTDQAALSGTVTNAKFNVFCFYVDAAGTGTSAMGTEGATIGAVVFPPVPEQKAWLGFVIINPTGTGNFVGGTTALDDATVAPNAVYVNLTGAAFDPTLVLG
jgi:hypothetical protein